MKKVLLGLILVIAACGEDGNNKGPNAPVGTPSDYVDQGEVAPAGADSMLGRWVSKPVPRGKDMVNTLKLKIESDKSTIAVLCTLGNESAQVEITSPSVINGNNLTVQAAKAKVVPLGDSFCGFQNDAPEHTYVIEVKDNVLKTNYMGHDIVMTRPE